MEPEKHVCGQCNEVWGTEQEYLDHECAATGFTPQDPAHLGPEFEEIQKAALERGAAQTQEKEE